jgi:hypothetical protein
VTRCESHDIRRGQSADLLGLNFSTECINGHGHALTSESTEQLDEVAEPLASRGLRTCVCQEKLQTLPDGTGVVHEHQPDNVAGVLRDDTSLSGLSDAFPSLGYLAISSAATPLPARQAPAGLVRAPGWALP